MTILSRMFAGLVIMVLAACSTQSEMRGLRAGMTPEQVDAVMGTPDGQAVSGSTLVKRYTNRFVPWEGPGVANYAAQFESGKLVAWGLESRNQNAYTNTSTVVIWQ